MGASRLTFKPVTFRRVYSNKILACCTHTKDSQICTTSNQWHYLESQERLCHQSRGPNTLTGATL